MYSFCSHLRFFLLSSSCSLFLSAVLFSCIGYGVVIVLYSPWGRPCIVFIALDIKHYRRRSNFVIVASASTNTSLFSLLLNNKCPILWKNVIIRLQKRAVWICDYYDFYIWDLFSVTRSDFFTVGIWTAEPWTNVKCTAWSCRLHHPMGVVTDWVWLRFNFQRIIVRLKSLQALDWMQFVKGFASFLE